jgi:hypothetical protein
VDEGQARVNRSVVIAPCPRRHPQPDAVLLKSHRGLVWRALPHSQALRFSVLGARSHSGDAPPFGRALAGAGGGLAGPLRAVPAVATRSSGYFVFKRLVIFTLVA